MDASSARPLRAGLSVVICCYNSAGRLPETLRHLRTQYNPEDIDWEVIVIDNASTDATAQVARDNWPVGVRVPMRVVREERAGLSSARIRGVAEAHFDVISFIDDDNWVPTDWIARVGALFAEHPEVGVSGARCEPEPEVAPPPWFERIQAFYATGSQHKSSGDVTDTRGTLLWGAGLSVRTQAMCSLFDGPFNFLMSDRTAENMASGGDTELCYALREAGWRFWYDDTLVLRHFVPQARLTWPYALRLMSGLGASSAMYDLYLQALRRPPFARYPAWKRTWLFQFFKALKDTLVLLVLHPMACLTKPEGSSPALQFQVAKGKIGRLVKLAGGYQGLRAQIRRQLFRTDPVL
jgi:glycosyltransferase involved in cell wall biosynthesis